MVMYKPGVKLVRSALYTYINIYIHTYIFQFAVILTMAVAMSSVDQSAAVPQGSTEDMADATAKDNRYYTAGMQ